MASERDNMAVGELQMDLPSQSDGTPPPPRPRHDRAVRDALAPPRRLRQGAPEQSRAARVRAAARPRRRLPHLTEGPAAGRAAVALALLRAGPGRLPAVGGRGGQERGVGQRGLVLRRLLEPAPAPPRAGAANQAADDVVVQRAGRTGPAGPGAEGPRGAAAAAPLHSRGNLHVTLLLFDEDWVACCPPGACYLVGCALASFYTRVDRHRPFRDVWRKHPVTLDPYPITGADAFTYAWVEALHHLSPELVKSLGIRSVEIVNTRRMVLWDEGTNAPFGITWVGAPALSHVKVGRRVPVWMVGYLRVVLEMLGLPDAVWVEHEDCGEGGRMDWSA